MGDVRHSSRPNRPHKGPKRPQKGPNKAQKAPEAQVASKVMRAPSPVTLGNLRLNVAVLMTAPWLHSSLSLVPCLSGSLSLSLWVSLSLPLSLSLSLCDAPSHQLLQGILQHPLGDHLRKPLAF